MKNWEELEPGARRAFVRWWQTAPLLFSELWLGIRYVVGLAVALAGFLSVMYAMELAPDWVSWLVASAFLIVLASRIWPPDNK